ncbi:MAG: MogA/MoaB family molybdenum cofactor biosynthesis protein [Bryobacteraceae bacterium]
MKIAAVLTISDSAAQGTRADRGGPAVRTRLEELGWSVPVMEVLPDEVDLIGARLRELADGGRVGAIFTTGGTGVAKRDVTPEATRTAIEREIPGIAESMRARGLEKTPRAALSRAVAGTRGVVLIINLPGSPKGAVESLDAIVELVPHVLDLLQGRTEHGSEGQK